MQNKPNMKPIIDPIPYHVLEQELTQDKFVRKTNFDNNEIYIVTHHNSPNVMLEIGRLREIAFRNAGGGTGKETDIDDYDKAEFPYKQLIVWNSEEKEIIGGYRFLNLGEYMEYYNGQDIKLATSKLFHLSENFKQNYLSHTIELGRSFVRPSYQSKKSGRKSLFALDNLWDGLGALVMQYPKIKYFFGKVTMYVHFDKFARDLLLFFMKKHFPDNENLAFPHEELPLSTSIEVLENIFIGNNYKEDYKILSSQVRKRKENIPPLINAYMNLSSTMRTFGTTINPNFGNVEETGILITIDDVYESKKKRHIDTFKTLV